MNDCMNDRRFWYTKKETEVDERLEIIISNEAKHCENTHTKNHRSNMENG